MIEIREGKLADHVDAMEALIRENWAETGFDFPLKLDVDRYKQFETLGILVAIGAFADGQVVGYSLASVLPHLYNPEIVCCNSDALFVRKDVRHMSIGARLMRETERVAHARGAHRMLWHTRGDTDLADVLYRRGYRTADIVMIRSLENGN